MNLNVNIRQRCHKILQSMWLRKDDIFSPPKQHKQSNNEQNDWRQYFMRNNFKPIIFILILTMLTIFIGSTVVYAGDESSDIWAFKENKHPKTVANRLVNKTVQDGGTTSITICKGEMLGFATSGPSYNMGARGWRLKNSSDTVIKNQNGVGTCSWVDPSYWGPINWSVGQYRFTSTGTFYLDVYNFRESTTKLSKAIKITVSNHTGGTHSNGGVCSRCGATYQTHSQSSTITGYIDQTDLQHTPVYACSFSGCTSTFTGTATNHTYGAYTMTSAQHSRTCTVCDYIDSGIHEDDNSDRYCDICNYYMASQISVYKEAPSTPSSGINNVLWKYYYRIENHGTTAQSVTIELRSYKGASGSKPCIRWTHSIPANSYHTYMWTSYTGSNIGTPPLGMLSYVRGGASTQTPRIIAAVAGKSGSKLIKPEYGQSGYIGTTRNAFVDVSTADKVAADGATALSVLFSTLSSSQFTIYGQTESGTHYKQSGGTVGDSPSNYTGNGRLTFSYTDNGCTRSNNIVRYNMSVGGHTPVYGCTFEGCSTEFIGTMSDHIDNNNDGFCDDCGYEMTMQLSSYTTLIDITNKPYSGLPYTPEVTIMDGNSTLIEGTDYTVAYSNNTNVGTATVTITGINDYGGTLVYNFNITAYTPTIRLSADNGGYTGLPVNIKPATVTGVSGQTISNEYVTYTYYKDSDLVTLTDNDSGASTSGGAPANRGIYYVVATYPASGNYAAATSNVARFKIEYDDLYYDDATVDTTPPSITEMQGELNGNTVSISARIEDPVVGADGTGSGIDASSIRYMVTNSATKPAVDNANWQASNSFTTALTGTLYGWIKASDNVGWTTIEGTLISGQIISLTDPSITIEFNDGPYTYNGTYFTPAVVVKHNGTALASDEYSVEYFDNKDVGTASIVITGHLGYTDSVTEHFTINPATITITPDSLTKYYGANDPELTFSYSGDVSGEYPEFDGSLQRVAGEEPGNYTISNSSTEPLVLTGGYNVKVSNYTLSVGTGTLSILPRPIIVRLNPTQYVYDGNLKTPEVTAVYEDETTVPSNLYTYTYSNNRDVGTATVNVTYAGTNITEEFYIIPATPTLTLSDRLNVTYNGTQVTIGTATNTGISATNKSNGAITYKYYIDEACSTEVPYSTSRTSNDGDAPVDAGTYYVRATIAADGNFGTATSNTATLEIVPKQVAVVWGETSLEFSGSAQTPTASANSGVTGETINLGIAGAQTNVGTGYSAVAYIDTVTNSSNGSLPTTNYTLTNAATSFEIIRTMIPNYLNVNTNTEYEKLSDALAEVASNQTIRVIGSDIHETITATLASGKTGVKFDLAGHTITLSGVKITNNGTLDIYTTANGAILQGNPSWDLLDNKGVLTINGTDSTKTISIKNTSAADCRVLSNASGKTVTLNSNVTLETTGAITDTRYVIDNSGTLNIAGATVKSRANTTANANRGIVNNNASARIIMTAGTIDTVGMGIYNASGTGTGSTPAVAVSNTAVIQTVSEEAIYTIATGTINVSNGTISTSSGNAIGNDSTGIINISGGQISSTSSAAVANYSAGTINISQASQSVSTTITGGTDSVRVSNGTVNITGGTISATNGVGVDVRSSGVLTIGTNETTPSVSTTVPSITGTTYGVRKASTTGTINFYDGVITGSSNNSINGTVDNVPTGYGVKKTASGSTEVATLAYAYTVNYYSNNTILSGKSDSFVKGMGSTIKTKATLGLTNGGYIFTGWATSNGGAKVYNDGVCVDSAVTSAGQVINLYAVWIENTMTVTSSGYSGVYDGAEHTITVNAPSGATVKYRTTTTGAYTTTVPTFRYFTNGPVTVYYQVTKNGYTTVTGSETVNITKRVLDINSFIYTPLTKVYDGNRNAPNGFSVNIPTE